MVGSCYLLQNSTHEIHITQSTRSLACLRSEVVVVVGCANSRHLIFLVVIHSSNWDTAIVAGRAKYA